MSNPKNRKNGGEGTAVGNFLRKIEFKDVAGVVGNVITGNFAGAIDAIKNSGELSEAQIQMALKELEQDVVDMQEITKRWESDMVSDSWLSKNVRPMIILFLTIAMATFIIIDSASDGFDVKEDWISLLSSLLLLVYGAYFGGRSLEKIQKMRTLDKDK